MTFRMGLQNAAEDGVRAALRYKPTTQERRDAAIEVAKQRSQWIPVAVKPFLDVSASCSIAGAAAGPCDEATCTSTAAWEQRCQIIVTVTAQRMDLLLPPILSLALPRQIVGQSSMLLSGNSS